MQVGYYLAWCKSKEILNHALFYYVELQIMIFEQSQIKTYEDIVGFDEETKLHKNSHASLAIVLSPIDSVNEEKKKLTI